MRQSNLIRSFAMAATLALAAGCSTEAAVQPAFVEASSAPGDLAVCPHAFYEGRAVYFTNDRWYAQDRGQWVYYRDEPSELHEHRLHAQLAARVPQDARAHALVEPVHARGASQLE